MQFSFITLLVTLTTFALANPAPPPPNCDITTSCINTGSTFHCACRAGYKASKNNNDIHSQFRLPMPNYEFLVFVPENTKCNTLCDNPYSAPGDLCKEVHLYNQCKV
ncbi:unnamed protein product [Penicillium pancosmium]